MLEKQGRGGKLRGITSSEDCHCKAGVCLKVYTFKYKTPILRKTP